MRHEYIAHEFRNLLLPDLKDRSDRPSCESAIAAYALVVDAKDDAAASYYRHHGFIAMPSTPLTLFLPLAAVKKLA